ncbi:MAG: hypothetical protein IGS50_20595 [Synechococcales cyanobacterium C42_A2020_086]|jgi:DNA-binding NarL/FixJ family response regulator|nr:hypothetical protein [Synechococcales cyanobacterium M58_A2018_015]MBF2076140.1 hypothetical protein [Synechococcales cyanobacterium C42_A2020_086]
MNQSCRYILVLDQDSDDLQMLEALQSRVRCPLVVTSSPDQAMAKMGQSPPSLLILTGNHQSWSASFVRRLRTMANACGIVIVGLTDVHAPSWLRQEDNPGLDGFLVKPLNCDILTSLLQSAWVRQTYCS